MAESLLTSPFDDMPAARRALRIAMVTETYPPEVNGVALTLQRVVEGLRARHHEVQLVRPRQRSDEAGESRSDGLQPDEMLVRGLPIPRYPQMQMGLPSKRSLLALWRRQRPDLVHIATEGPLGWSALQAAEALALPVCSDFRTNFHAYSRHYGIGWLQRPIMGLLRSFHNRCAITMVPSDQLRQELAQSGFERLELVTRGVDTALFDPRRRSDALRRRWGADADTPVVLFVGRLAPEKNLQALADAFLAMRAEQPRMRLVVVGEGPSRQELAERVPDAIFTGSRRGEDLAAHYASADLFVFPSMTETFGNVTLEAMASGLAVLAYDHAGARQLIRGGDNGLLARYGDAQDFLRQAVWLAGHRAEARRMALRARATAGEFGWERIVMQIESVFATTLATRPLMRSPELAREVEVEVAAGWP